LTVTARWREIVPMRRLLPLLFCLLLPAPAAAGAAERPAPTVDPWAACRTAIAAANIR